MTPRKFNCYMVAVGAATHPKFARLTDGERCAHFLGVLAVAAMSPVRGCLLVGKLPAQAIDVARTAGVSERVARSTMDKLQAVGVLVPDDEHGCYRVHDWDDINPSPGAERTRQWRDKQTSQETSQNHHANVTKSSPEVEVEVEVKERAKALSRRAERAEDKSTEDDKRLCKLLADLAKQRNPKFQVRSKGRWLTDMRLLRERDHNQPAEIERALRWVFTNPGKDARFWADVIQSPGNLREHFPRIWAQMIAPPVAVNGSPPVEDSASFLARRRAMA